MGRFMHEKIPVSSPKFWLWSPAWQSMDAKHKRRLVNRGFSGIAWRADSVEDLIAKSDKYGDVLEQVASCEASPEEAYEALMLRQAQRLAGELQPVYRRSKGREGFAAVEINPELAYDTASLVDEAHRLKDVAGLHNLMIQIPGTHEAFPAISRAVEDGVSVHVTHLVSLSGYRQTLNACLDGMHRRHRKGESPAGILCAATIVLDAEECRFAMHTMTSSSANRLQAPAPELPKTIAMKAMRSVLAMHEASCLRDSFVDRTLRGASPVYPLWVSPSGTNGRFMGGSKLPAGWELALDLTSIEPEQLESVQSDDEGPNKPDAEAQVWLDLFLGEPSTGDSVMDSLQRQIILTKALQFDLLLADLVKISAHDAASGLEKSQM